MREGEPERFFYLVGRRKRRVSRQSSSPDDDVIDEYLMRPCVGLGQICQPLCTWAQLNDGTYTLADVERFHIVMDRLLDSLPEVSK